jgi:hypothetical protein
MLPSRIAWKSVIAAPLTPLLNRIESVKPSRWL